MSKRPTISDVAQRAGVSKGTVSAVLNGKDSVHERTRERVREAIEQLNYRPSAPAMLRGKTPKRRSIGLVIKEMDNPYYMEIAAGALAQGRKHGYTVLVTSSEGDYQAEKEAVELLRDQGVDGLILTPVFDEETDLSHLFELKRRNFPFVLLEEIRGVRASLVDVDNAEAMQAVVRSLIEQGHTRLVHFAGPEYSMHSRERIDGVQRAFSGSQLIFSEATVIPTGAHLRDGYRAGLAYFRDLDPAERPTAATCYNDLVALGLLRALTELGIRVPEDVCVVGYDDLPILEYLPVSLSSVHVPKYEMGQRSTEILIHHIEAQKTLPPLKIHLESTLVDRGSTALRPVPR
ncbi:MAG TPA: LacI family DNA-binding transcriptional regulator [Longimicrobiaceae bacterium]|nr:LacI family DNA-binding transcriptional regulator [Longimicrobiaceae bacterium]